MTLYYRRIRVGGYWGEPINKVEGSRWVPLHVSYRITDASGKLVDSFLYVKNARKVHGKVVKKC